MATKSLTLALDLSQINDVGETPAKALIESFVLQGFTQFTTGRIALAAAASDTAIAFTAAIAVIIVSHDNAFKLRIAAGETLLANLKAFVVYADDALDHVRATSVLLTGNGTTVADLEYWIVEKP